MKFCAGKYFRVLWIMLFLGLNACKINEFEPGIIPPDPGKRVVSYPLNFPVVPGVSGEVTFSALEDGTAIVKTRLNGTQTGSRYFAKLSVSNANDYAINSDLADLGEISADNGQGIYWLKKNYRNNPILYDSLLVADAKVRILELSPTTLAPREVLRGDIGLNALAEGRKSFGFIPLGGSLVQGTIEIRQRNNGKFTLQAKLTGFQTGQSLQVSYFSGSYETGNFTKQEYLGNYSSGQDAAFFNCTKWKGMLSMLDTLSGFLGVESAGSRPDSLRFESICNLGGNLASGREKFIPVFGEIDSARIGVIRFIEVGSSLRMRFQPEQIPSGSQFYLSLNRGNSLSVADSFFFKPVSSGQILEFSGIPRGDGQILSFGDLETWDAHARITEAGFSNQIGKADIGANEVLFTDSLTVFLSEPNPVSQAFQGKLIFRPRRNQKVICFYQLTGSQGFIQNNLIIRNPPKPTSFSLADTTSPALRLASFLGGAPGMAKGSSVVLSVLNEPVTWDILQQKKFEGGYAEYNFSDEGFIQEIFSRGPFSP